MNTLVQIFCLFVFFYQMKKKNVFCYLVIHIKHRGVYMKTKKKLYYMHEGEGMLYVINILFQLHERYCIDLWTSLNKLSSREGGNF